MNRIVNQIVNRECFYFFGKMLKKCLTLAKLCDTMELPLEIFVLFSIVMSLKVGGWHSRRLMKNARALLMVESISVTVASVVQAHSSSPKKFNGEWLVAVPLISIK